MTLDLLRPRRGASAPRPRRHNAPALLAIEMLEPRVLLDAAAAQTALEVVQPASDAPAATDSETHAGLVAALDAMDDAARAEASSPAPTAIYFIDSTVADADQLVAELPADAELHFIARDVDGVAYIAQTLQGRSGVEEIHIVSHGTTGALTLGSAVLDADTMAGTHADELQSLRAALTDDADILLYGCDFAADPAGVQAAQLLADLTGADVAASSDATGAVALGGDWDLEVKTGAVEATGLASAAYEHLLEDGPQIDLDTATPGTGYSAGYDQSAIAIGGAISVGDPQGDNLQSMRIALADATAADSLYLTGEVSGIGASYDAATGVLTLSGNATLADYQAALGMVRYSTTSSATVARTVSVSAVSAADAAASNVAVVTITPIDTDRDGVANAADIDDDNDGIVDARETDASAATADGLTNFTYWRSPSRHNWHDLVPLNGSFATLPDLDPYGLPTNNSTPMSSGTVAGLAEPPGTDASGAIDIVRYQGYLVLPPSLYGETVQIRLNPNSGSVGGGAWVVSSDALPAHWIDPVSVVTGEQLLDMDNSEGYANPQHGWSGPPIGYSDFATTRNGASLGPSRGGHPEHFQAAIVASSEGHYFSLWEVDPTNAWSAHNFQYSTDGSNWVDLNGSNYASTPPIRLDVDNDGDRVVNRLDLDSDNDGITDNVEAQATAGYKAPSGQGDAMVDADNDGLDDRYDASMADTRASSVSIGLVPVNTDTDGTPDFLDADSDQDNTPDIAERGDGQPTSVTSTADADGDGLLDIFEHGTPNDGHVVHDGAVRTSGSGLSAAVTAFDLGDVDGDTAADGRDAAPRERDLDWRDNVTPPAIDLNSAVGAADGSRDHQTRYAFGDAAAHLTTATADVDDLGDNDLSRLGIAVTGVQDGSDEIVRIGGADFALSADRSQTVSVDGVDLLVDYTVAAGFVVTRTGGGVIPQATLDGLLRGITYRNTRAAATLGERRLTFSVADAGGASAAPAVAIVRVVAPNQPPSAADDAASGPEDRAISGNVLANDTDPEGGALTVTGFSVAGEGVDHAAGRTATIAGVGTLTIAADGAFTFTPVADYNGTVPVITYTVRDSGGASDSGQLTIAVTPVNDAPVPRDPAAPPPGQTFDAATGRYTATTQEDTTFAGQVSAGDVDRDALTYTVSAQPAHGTVTVDAATGAYTYTPAADYHGADSFEVTISDGQGGTARSMVNMTVTPVADIAADTAMTREDTAVDIAVLGNDSFEDPGRTVTAVDGMPITSGGPGVDVANGTVTLQADGTLRFVPAANFNGTSRFSYTVTAGGVSETADVHVNVGATNDPPVPREPAPPAPGQTFDPATGHYTANTQEDTAFAGQVSASDVDGDALTYTVSTQPSHGTVRLDAATGAYTYTPTADYNGADSFEVSISDSRGGTARSTVNMTVTPAADIAADTATTREDTPVDIAVLGNDSFENTGRRVTAINGTAVTAGTPVAVANGMVTLRADGTLRFVPSADFNGALTFSYTVGSGGASETANVTVQVTPVNDAPVPREPNPSTPGQTFDPASGRYTATTQEDTAFAGRVAANDVDGDTLTYTVSAQPAHGTVVLDAATGAYTYTPAADYNGADSFEVTISDSRGGTARSTVNITITPVADIAADTATTREDMPVDIAVLGNDSFEDTGRRVTAIDGTAVTAGTTVAVADGTVTLQADGTLRFVPAANFNGTSRFSYTVSSGGVSETADVHVNVGATNDPPVPREPAPPTPGQTFDPATGHYTATTQEDTAFEGRVAANDVDGDPLTYTVSTQPSHGTVTLDAATGAYTYTPTADYNGADSFEVSISDGRGGTTRSTVNMTITPVADIAADRVSTREDTPLDIAVLGNDSFEDIGRRVTAINGTAVTAGISDGQGGTARSTVNMIVTPVADIAADRISTREDTSVDIAVLSNDSFENTGRRATAINGTAVTAGTPVAVSNGTVTLQADGTLRFAPATDFHGALSFSYTVDAGGARETANVTVEVTPVNDPPLRRDSAMATTQEDTVFEGRVVADDVDGDMLTYAVSTPPAHGTATLDAATGAYTYTPAADYNGADSFEVSVSDGRGGTARSTVNMTITPVADIASDRISTREDTPVDIAVLGNDSFEDTGRRVTAINGTAVTAGTPVAVSNGTMTLQADGTLRFVPAADFHGALSFSYTVDAGGASETANVTVEVTPVNDAPMPREPIPPTPGQIFDPRTGHYTATTQEDTPFEGRVAANDVDGDTLTYTVSTQPAHGTVTLDAATGAYTYTPAADYNGTDSFEVSISDARGGTARSTVNMSVTPVADIAADRVSTREDTPLDIAVLGNDSFEDTGRRVTAINGTAVTAGTPVAVSNGMVTLQADGTLRFVPTADFHGALSFSYTVASSGVSETANVTVEVATVNDAPVPRNPETPPPGQRFDPATGHYTATTQEDAAFNGRVAANDMDGDPLTYAVHTQPAHGTVTLDASTGAYTYTPTADYNGTDSFELTISDGQGGTARSTVTLTIAPVADIAADTATTDEDTPVDIAVLGNDSFENPGRRVTAIDGAAVTPGTPVAVSNGTVTLQPDGTLRFVPAAGFHGALSFSYTVGAGGASETGRVTVNVIPVPETPAPAQPPAQPAPVVLAPPPPVPTTAPAPAPAPAPAAAGNGLRAEPVLLGAVEGAESLQGTTGLDGAGVVVLAANGIDSLDGTAALDVDGVVLRAVNAVDSLRGLDAGGDGRGPSWRSTPTAPSADAAAPQPAAAQALRTPDGVRLEFEQQGRRAWISVGVADGVRGLRVTLDDGRPAPAWLRVDPSGFVRIDRPAGVEQLRLRITLIDEHGTARSERVEIDFDTGQVRRLTDPVPAGPRAAAPSFSEQLQRAARPAVASRETPRPERVA